MSLSTFSGMFSDADGNPSDRFKELSASPLSGLSAGLNYNTIAGFSGSVNYSYPTDKPDENAPRQRADEKDRRALGLSVNFDRTGVSSGLSITDQLGTSLSLGRNSAQGFETDSMSWSAGNLAVAQDAFDDVMYDRNTAALNKTLPEIAGRADLNENDPDDAALMNAVNGLPRDDSGDIDFSKVSPDEVAGLLSKLSKKDPTAQQTNKMHGHSFAEGFKGAADSFLSGVANDFTNMFTAGSGNITSSAGMIDENGKFHPRTCFVAGTLVVRLKADFKEKAGSLAPSPVYEEKVAIEKIQKGDYVASYDELKGKKSYRQVTELFERKTDLIFTVVFSTGEKLETTWNHPFWIIENHDAQKRGPPALSASLFYGMSPSSRNIPKGKWIAAKDLKPGQKALTKSGTAVTVTDVRQERRSETVYNFAVQENHTYYVGQDGVLVHNESHSYLSKPTSANLISRLIGNVPSPDEIKLAFPNADKADEVFNVGRKFATEIFGNTKPDSSIISIIERAASGVQISKEDKAELQSLIDKRASKLGLSAEQKKCFEAGLWDKVVFDQKTTDYWNAMDFASYDVPLETFSTFGGFSLLKLPFLSKYFAKLIGVENKTVNQVSKAPAHIEGNPPKLPDIEKGYIYDKANNKLILESKRIDKPMTSDRPNWRQTEKDIAKQNPSYAEQKSFKDGKEVPYGTPGSSRPDLFKPSAIIDAKNYNLSKPSGINNLISNISTQYTKNIKNLPKGESIKQTFVLDIRGQNIPVKTIEKIIDHFKDQKNLVIEVIR